MTDAQKMLVAAMNDPSATPEQTAAIAALLETTAFSGGHGGTVPQSGGHGGTVPQTGPTQSE